MDPLLFALRETPQASTGYAPFELVYGRRPRGILELAEDQWAPRQADKGVPPGEHVQRLKARLEAVRAVARDNLESAQQAQKATYDQGTKARTFSVGDKVWVRREVLGPHQKDPWGGPFPITRVLGPLTYDVQCGPGRRGRKPIHINHLKGWVARGGAEECHLATPPDELPTGELPWGPTEPDEGVQPQIGEELSSPQKEDLRRVLERTTGVFSLYPGHTLLAEHRISTPPGVVVRTPWRPVPRKRWDAVDKEVEAMLRMGVIEPSHSDWRSPIVMVPKPDGSIRFCIDYREVNRVAKFDAYPMSRTSTLIDQLGTATYLSALDLTKGYWQVPVHPEDREKTAFATPKGLYQFRRMPFGLHGAAATFQRLVDRALVQCQEFTVAYIDDIIIFSPDWPTHVRHLEQVLHALAQAGLRINPKKSHLGFKELKYLGFLVGNGQLKPLPERVTTLQTSAAPTTKKQLRRFLGLIGYYSRFIPQYATIASPLTDGLRKDQPNRIRWTPEQLQAFTTLRDALLHAPVLHNPDFSKPFILQTDASNTGIGAVLSQDFDGQDHPILFISRKLQLPEQKFATVEKEALAVKWAVGTLQYYLTDNPFTLVVDHEPLCWMTRMKDHNHRVLRWYISLLPFRFSIQHRAGREHLNADYMSRVFEETSPGLPLRGEVCPDLAHRGPDVATLTPPKGAAYLPPPGQTRGIPRRPGRRPPTAAQPPSPRRQRRRKGAGDGETWPQRRHGAAPSGRRAPRSLPSRLLSPLLSCFPSQPRPGGRGGQRAADCRGSTSPAIRPIGASPEEGAGPGPRQGRHLEGESPGAPG